MMDRFEVMPSHSEQVVNRTLDAKESLRLSCRFEAHEGVLGCKAEGDQQEQEEVVSPSFIRSSILHRVSSEDHWQVAHTPA